MLENNISNNPTTQIEQGKLGDKWFLDEVFRKLFKTQPRKPSVIITDKLPSYQAALREIGVKIKHDTRQYANNIAQISHQKISQQQRQMRNFKSITHAQKFLADHALINNLLRHQHHLAKTSTYRLLLKVI